MTPPSSPEKKVESFPNADYPWPIVDSSLRKESLFPTKLFGEATEEKTEDKALKDRLVTVRRDGGPHDDTKEKIQ